MNKVQLGNHLVWQDEGVKVRLAHAARHFVEHGRQAQPVVQKIQKVLCIRVIRLIKRVQREGRDFKLRAVGRQTKAQCRVDGIAHVQVMRPTLGPVLPRVHAGVGADVMQPPPGGRALLVVLPQCGCIVEVLVAKKRSETVNPARSVNQPVPVIVAHFMPKMPQQRAVGLAHCLAHRFAHCVVSLVQAQGDQPGVVTGHDMRAVVGRAQKVKHQAALGVFGHARSYRQSERQQGRHQPAFGQLYAAPKQAVVRVQRVIEVGNHPVQAAGPAKQHAVLRAVGRHQPVAGRRRLQVGAAGVAAGL